MVSKGLWCAAVMASWLGACGTAPPALEPADCVAAAWVDRVEGGWTVWGVRGPEGHREVRVRGGADWRVGDHAWGVSGPAAPACARLTRQRVRDARARLGDRPVATDLVLE